MTATELYLMRFPSGTQPTRVSGEGGAEPVAVRWTRNDDRLFYVRRSDGVMMEVEVTLGDEPRLGEPRELFDPRISGLDLVTAGFDVSADGSRFLAVRQVVPRGAHRTRWILASNWLSRAR